MRTKHAFTWTRPLGPITVPAGVRVERLKEPDGDGTYGLVVAEFGWMKGGDEFYKHDAIHYGIRVNPENVTEEG